jgi:hypothetical protein
VIIDYTYFTGNLTIAQLSQSEVVADLNILIEREEPAYLKKLLGLGFYRAFEAGIDPISGADQRWLDILQGVEYEYNGTDYEWIGLENSQKQSPIANYIYTKYLEKEVVQSTGIGQVKPATENGSLASITPKVVRAWNEMVDWEYALIRFLHENAAIYPEWKPYSTNYWFFNWDGSRYLHRYPCNKWPDIFHPRNTLGI